MMAELVGRVAGIGIDKATGALTQVVVSSEHGEVTIYRPDSWQDDIAFHESLGKRVTLRVVMTVEA